MRDSSHRWVYAATGCVIQLMILLSLIIPKGDDVLWINGHHSAFADRFFTFITYGGDGLAFLPVLLISLFIHFRLSLISLVAWAGHGLLCGIFKRTFFSHMLRPAGILDHDLLYFVPGITVHNNFSFPSGHTATAFCIAVVVSLLSRSRILTAILLLLAMLVGYSRIYLLQHFLVDVAAGAFIGASVGAITWHLFDTYGKAHWLGLHMHLQLKAGNTSMTAR